MALSPMHVAMQHVSSARRAAKSLPFSATQAAVSQKLSGLNVQLEILMEMDNPEAVKHAVQGGMGVAFISKFAVEAELKAKILAVAKVAGFSVFRELKIVYRKNKHLSRAAQALIEMATSGSPNAIDF